MLVGDVLVGDGPAGSLDPVDISARELQQLLDRARLPRWVVEKGSFGPGYVTLKALMRQESLVTVCEEASCPNIQRCWSRGTATFMISGETCTRGCRFCDVATGKPMLPPDPEEPGRVAEAAAAMGLRYVVVTAVARDDRPDGGAAHFASVIRALRDRLPDTRVEVLIPDFRGNWDALDMVIEAAPDVLNVGQYLSPGGPKHLPVGRFYAPAEYPALAEMGNRLGLVHVEAGPLVRSSFEADRVADEMTTGVV